MEAIVLLLYHMSQDVGLWTCQYTQLLNSHSIFRNVALAYIQLYKLTLEELILPMLEAVT